MQEVVVLEMLLLALPRVLDLHDVDHGGADAGRCRSSRKQIERFEGSQRYLMFVSQSFPMLTQLQNTWAGGQRTGGQVTRAASQPVAWSQPGGLGSTVTIRCSLHPPHPASPRGLQPLIKPQ